MWSRLNRDPVRAVALVVLFVFVFEGLLMMLLANLPVLPHWVEGTFDATVLCLLLVPALYFAVYRPLQRQIAEREQSQVALEEARATLQKKVDDQTFELRQSNEKLEAKVSELERKGGENKLLSAMAELLQTCASSEEAHETIRRYAEQLFPRRSGTLCIMNASRNFLESAVTWGVTQGSSEVYPPDQCWALRRGRIHRGGSLLNTPVCAHITCGGNTSYLCAPLIAHGDALGVFQLYWQDTEGDAADTREWQSEEQHLVTIFSEHIALALANLRLRESLRSQSIRDPLTALFNRRYLEETLEREVCRVLRNGQVLSVLMLDIDHFKEFNDTFGHAAGDTVLREFAGFLRAHVRAGDVVCRYGGEEFTILLLDNSRDGVFPRCEAIRAGVESLSIEHHGQSMRRITISIGAAVCPEHGDTAESLLHAADNALYRAKAEGRNRVVLAWEAAPNVVMSKEEADSRDRREEARE